METLLDLNQLGTRLASVDKLIVALAKKRMDLALQVGRYKIQSNDPIFRSDVEDKRINIIRDFAVEKGLNPHFAESLLYLLINESCKQQMIQLQDGGSRLLEFESEDEWYEKLKANLLVLTERWCVNYDEEYEKPYFATHSYLEFETDLLRREVARLDCKGIFIDLGCATGRLTFQLAPLFEKAIGYDVSPHMIEVAQAKVASVEGGVIQSLSVEI